MRRHWDLIRELPLQIEEPEPCHHFVAQPLGVISYDALRKSA